MNYVIAFCVVAALATVAVGHSHQKEKICEPGSLFMDDCNRCRCSTDGYEKSCTRIQCVPKREKRDAEDSCQPGSMFKIECNECVCPESGLRSRAACTLKACLEERTKRENQGVAESDRCEPGTNYKLDCNTCLCPPSGLKGEAACTLKLCI